MRGPNDKTKPIQIHDGDIYPPSLAALVSRRRGPGGESSTSTTETDNKVADTAGQVEWKMTILTRSSVQLSSASLGAPNMDREAGWEGWEQAGAHCPQHHSLAYKADFVTLVAWRSPDDGISRIWR